jgi:hypothetical protein
MNTRHVIRQMLPETTQPRPLPITVPLDEDLQRVARLIQEEFRSPDEARTILWQGVMNLYDQLPGKLKSVIKELQSKRPELDAIEWASGIIDQQFALTGLEQGWQDSVREAPDSFKRLYGEDPQAGKKQAGQAIEPNQLVQEIGIVGGFDEPDAGYRAIGEKTGTSLHAAQGGRQYYWDVGGAGVSSGSPSPIGSVRVGKSREGSLWATISLGPVGTAGRAYNNVITIIFPQKADAQTLSQQFTNNAAAIAENIRARLSNLTYRTSGLPQKAIQRMVEAITPRLENSVQQIGQQFGQTRESKEDKKDDSEKLKPEKPSHFLKPVTTMKSAQMSAPLSAILRVLMPT